MYVYVCVCIMREREYSLMFASFSRSSGYELLSSCLTVSVSVESSSDH